MFSKVQLMQQCNKGERFKQFKILILLNVIAVGSACVEMNIKKKEGKGYKEKKHYNTICGTVETSGISAGQGYLDNYNLIYQLKEENAKLKNCILSSADLQEVKICVEDN